MKCMFVAVVGIVYFNVAVMIEIIAKLRNVGR